MSRISEELSKEYGLKKLMEQNDIEEEHVVGLLITLKLIDPNDYMFYNVDQRELDLKD
jgi:hypothetical protein